LAYLKDFPLSRVKFDRSFINDIGKDENAERLLTSVISMVHGLGLEVVAEGIEEQHQVDFLKALGCEYFQGYFFGRPVPPEEATRLLDARHAA
jgi:EAL domain-containing protein (putative c-di-GMP-specific phosphodiesterase class I)